MGIYALSIVWSRDRGKPRVYSMRAKRASRNATIRLTRVFGVILNLLTIHRVRVHEAQTASHRSHGSGARGAPGDSGAAAGFPLCDRRRVDERHGHRIVEFVEPLHYGSDGEGF